MKWIVKLVVEPTSGHTVEHEITTLEREDQLSPATVGLNIAEGKLILERLQTQIVAAQTQHHNASLKSCFRCGRSFRTKGYYQSTLGKTQQKEKISHRNDGCAAFVSWDSFC